MRTVAFKFDIGQDVYFLDQGEVKSDKIEYGQIHMTKDNEITIKYKLKRRNTCNVLQETLFEDVADLVFNLEQKAKKAGHLMTKQ